MVSAARLIAASFIVAVLLSAGCNDPYAVRQNAHRREKVQWIADSYMEREARCEPNLEKTFDMYDSMGVPYGNVDHALETWIWLIH